jgi:hypothetical protein
MAILISPSGCEEKLRWTDQHPASRYGLGVVLYGTRSLVLHGAQFRAYANKGAVIVCADDHERRRVAGALAWGVLAIGDNKLIVRNEKANPIREGYMGGKASPPKPFQKPHKKLNDFRSKNGPPRKFQ